MDVKKWINSLWNQHQNIDEYINDQINAWVRTWDRCRGISNNLSTYSNFLFEYVLKYLVAVTWGWDCRFEYFLRVEAEFCTQLCLVAAGPGLFQKRFHYWTSANLTHNCEVKRVISVNISLQWPTVSPSCQISLCRS